MGYVFFFSEADFVKGVVVRTNILFRWACVFKVSPCLLPIKLRTIFAWHKFPGVSQNELK